MPKHLPGRVLVAPLVCLGVTAGWLLACTGAGGGEGGDNASACERYVEHMNELDCMTLTYDADEVCAGASLSPADMVPYWECARANARCDGDTPVIDIAQCRQPIM
jgi:hypothetical protein